MKNQDAGLPNGYGFGMMSNRGIEGGRTPLLFRGDEVELMRLKQTSS